MYLVISKKKAIFLGVILVIITAMVTSAFQLTLGNKVVISKELYEDYKKYDKLLGLESIIKQDFYKKVSDTDLVNGAAKGLFLGTNDKYSGYYTKDEMENLINDSEGSYVGVGMYIGASKDGGLVVVPMKDSPAEKAGVKSGDKLVKVNGKSVSYKNSDEAVRMMKGKKGKTVELTILREDKQLNFKVKTDQIIEKSIESKVIDNDLGYIEITQFISSTYTDFDKALKELKAKNIKGLVIDLRNNPGGMLDICKEVADELIGEGTIVYTKDNKGNTEYLKSDKEKLGLPIVVLTNGESASAAEILTVAIVDNKEGISVGTTTFGKGLVQSVVRLKDGTGYKLTTAQYFTPNGDYINEKGIKPTIEEKDENKQLDVATKWLREQIDK
ncbi:TPA: S41 family peptidase [Clostridioides difficile]|nr:S41 family peptidase [Clostridioides difficile]HBF2582767.1 S41 family peptidase [Clostridioides difficile]HBF3815833.1 S41 family peptidase [Clostridioides difficile]HBF3892988.1 S41 family peptidase [Clostridioides difficile]HBF8447586.1 S41 family peptidase [Clostridioides difficile]